MNKDIINYDKNGNRHGKQIDYYINGNIWLIRNYNHGKLNGYRGYFKSNKTIEFKQYWNMDKCIYDEDHLWSEQIEIII